MSRIRKHGGSQSRTERCPSPLHRGPRAYAIVRAVQPQQARPFRRRERGDARPLRGQIRRF